MNKYYRERHCYFWYVENDDNDWSIDTEKKN